MSDKPLESAAVPQSVVDNYMRENPDRVLGPGDVIRIVRPPIGVVTLGWPVTKPTTTEEP